MGLTIIRPSLSSVNEKSLEHQFIAFLRDQTTAVFRPMLDQTFYFGKFTSKKLTVTLGSRLAAG